jgi:AcrR family transcriptional regulator
MTIDTKNRLLETATTLFASHGYRGASVRHICDLARANPGAVSYHFGGKKQLYRTALRRAATALSDLGLAELLADDPASPPSVADVIERIVDQTSRCSKEIRLLVRDLADGGDVAVEALEPTLRSALENLRLAIGDDAAPRGSASGHELFVDLGAPIFLLTAAWPVLQRALDLEADQQRTLIAGACRRALKAHGLELAAIGES